MTHLLCRGLKSYQKILLLYGLSPVLAIGLASCKLTRGGSDTKDSATLTEPQKLMLADLNTLKGAPSTPIFVPPKPATSTPFPDDPPPINQSNSPVDPMEGLLLAEAPNVSGFKHIPNIDSIEPVSSVVRRLTPEADGTFSLTIDDLKIKIDPKPSSTDKKFTDFFTALNKGVGELAQSGKGQGNLGESARQILDAYKARDLDLSGSRITREDTDRGLGFANPKAKTVSVHRPYTQIRQIYILSGLARLAEATRSDANRRPTLKAPATSSIKPECERRRTLISPSILPFKRGDLDRTCSVAIDTAIKQGFLRMTLFHPVHVAGEFRHHMGMMEFESNPKYGRDYRVERLLAPSAGELRRCVSSILDAGLELTYIPHIEYITTMVGQGEVEWRIGALIPLDNPQLYDATYAPVIDVLKTSAPKIRNRVSISIAAEVDRAAFYFAESTLNLVRRLKSDLSFLPASKLQLTLNPNGDFNAISSKEFQNILADRGTTSRACSNISDLLRNQVGSIGPSIYDAYGHVFPMSFPEYKKPNFGATRSEFLRKLSFMVSQFCSDKKEIDSIAKNIENKFDIGEFSLQIKPSDFSTSRMDSYGSFLNESLAGSESPHGRMNLWSSGEPQYDPLSSTAQDQRPAQQILNFLQCK